MNTLHILITASLAMLTLTSCDAQERKKTGSAPTPPSTSTPTQAATPKPYVIEESKRTRDGEIVNGTWKRLENNMFTPAELAVAHGKSAIVSLDWSQYMRGGGDKGLVLVRESKPLPKNQVFVVYATAHIVQPERPDGSLGPIGLALIPNNGLVGLLLQEAEAGSYSLVKLGKINLTETGKDDSGEPIFAERADIILDGETNTLIMPPLSELSELLKSK